MGQRLENFYKTNSFKSDNNLFYGVYRNRVISFTLENRSYVATISFNGQLDRDTGMKLNEKVKEIKANNRVLLQGLTTNVYLELKFFYSNNVDEEMLNVIDSVLDVMDSLNFPTCEVCPICRQNMASNEPFIKLKNQIIQAHQPCIDQLVGQFNSFENSFKKTDKKSVITLVMLSLMTSVLTIGIMCAIAAAGAFAYFSVLSGWLCFLICNFMSFKLKIKNNTTKITIILVFSIIALFTSLYLGTVIDIFRQLSQEGYTINDVFANYFAIIGENMGSYGRNLIIDTGLSLVFLGFPAYANYKQVLKVSNKIKKL